MHEKSSLLSKISQWMGMDVVLKLGEGKRGEKNLARFVG